MLNKYSINVKLITLDITLMKAQVESSTYKLAPNTWCPTLPDNHPTLTYHRAQVWRRPHRWSDLVCCRGSCAVCRRSAAGCHRPRSSSYWRPAPRVRPHSWTLGYSCNPQPATSIKQRLSCMLSDHMKNLNNAVGKAIANHSEVQYCFRARCCCILTKCMYNQTFTLYHCTD